MQINIKKCCTKKKIADTFTLDGRSISVHKVDKFVGLVIRILKLDGELNVKHPEAITTNYKL